MAFTNTLDRQNAAAESDWDTPLAGSFNRERAQTSLYRLNLTEMKPFTKQIAEKDQEYGPNGESPVTERPALRLVFSAREVLEGGVDFTHLNSDEEPFNFTKSVNLTSGKGSPATYWHSKNPRISDPGIVTLVDQLIGRQLSDQEARTVSMKKILEAVMAQEINYKGAISLQGGSNGQYNQIDNITLIAADKPKVEAILKALAARQPLPGQSVTPKSPSAPAAATAPPKASGKAVAPVGDDMDDPFRDN